MQSHSDPKPSRRTWMSWRRLSTRDLTRLAGCAGLAARPPKCLAGQGGCEQERPQSELPQGAEPICTASHAHCSSTLLLPFLPFLPANFRPFDFLSSSISPSPNILTFVSHLDIAFNISVTLARHEALAVKYSSRQELDYQTKRP